MLDLLATREHKRRPPAGRTGHQTLYADGYRYDHGVASVGADTAGVTLACRLESDVPARLPEVAWRAGLDLNSLDLAGGDDDLTWLEALV